MNQGPFHPWVVFSAVLLTALTIEITNKDSHQRSVSDFSFVQTQQIHLQQPIGTPHSRYSPPPTSVRSSSPIPTAIKSAAVSPQSSNPPPSSHASPTPPSSLPLFTPPQILLTILAPQHHEITYKSELKFEATYLSPLSFRPKRILQIDGSIHELPTKSMNDPSKTNTVTKISLQGIQPGQHTATVSLLHGSELLISATTTFTFANLNQRKTSKKKHVHTMHTSCTDDDTTCTTCTTINTRSSTCTEGTIMELELELNQWHILHQTPSLEEELNQRGHLETELQRRLFPDP